MGFALSDMQVTSSSFDDNHEIPSKHTGESTDISPSLKWQGAPEETKSFAILCHDPDAPLISAVGAYGYVHWSLYNIPADVTELSEGCELYTNGVNDFGSNNYGGPMPPAGHGQHKYYFWVLALDTMLDLPEGLTQQELLAKVEPHCIAMNRLIGTYQRN